MTFISGISIEHFHVGKLFSSEFEDNVTDGLCIDTLTPSIFVWTFLNLVFVKHYQWNQLIIEERKL